MGVVYKARDPQIDRLVAVKTVSLGGQHPDDEQEFRLRFMNEAQAAGRLHHPGIVAIFDVGECPENGEPYIVLEYVAGEALNRVLAREKKLPLERALKLAEEIADALDYAHAQGVVHRDVKPANILVTEEGHAKIADFGIAKLNLAHFTLPGHVLGTPAFMAPEQLNGDGADGRSDLFSLGVILYAMVTGHAPFQGNSATTVCFKVANREPVAASALDLSLPPELDAVIARAMAKDPEQRYQHGAEFAEDLRQLQHDLKPGSITSSLRPAISTGIRSTGTRSALSAEAQHIQTVERGQQAVRRVFQKAPIRDLILGAAILTTLVIVAAQLKLLKTSRDVATASGSPSNAIQSAGRDAANESPATAQPSQASTTPSTLTQPAAAQSTSPAVSSPPSSHLHAAKLGSTPICTLDLAVQHQFIDATLYVWIDDRLALTRPLHGGNQKHLVVFNGVRGVDSETLKIPAGKHVLRLRTLSADRTVDLSKSVSAEFVGGDNRSLQITFDKHNSAMRLTWQ
jgi:serine/threonine protein kinase